MAAEPQVAPLDVPDHDSTDCRIMVAGGIMTIAQAHDLFVALERTLAAFGV